MSLMKMLCVYQNYGKGKKMNKFYDATQPYLDELEDVEGEIVSSIWLAELLLNGKVVGTLQGETEKEIQDLIERWTR